MNILGEVIKDSRIEQCRKIVESLVSKSMFYNTDILLTTNNKVIIVVDKTVIYIVELKDMINSYPLIAFRYSDILLFESNDCCVNNIFLANDLNNLYMYYSGIISGNPVASNLSLRDDEKFEELLQLKAADGMRYYHMLGNDMKTYLIPIFSGFPNLSKPDKLGMSVYDTNDGFLAIKMDIFKKKINSNVIACYRTLKLN